MPYAILINDDVFCLFIRKLIFTCKMNAFNECISMNKLVIKLLAFKRNTFIQEKFYCPKILFILESFLSKDRFILQNYSCKRINLSSEKQCLDN